MGLSGAAGLSAAGLGHRTAPVGMCRFLAAEKEGEDVPLVIELRSRAEHIRRAETDKARRRMGGLTPEQEEALEAVTTAIVDKLLQAPNACLKEMAGRNMTVEQAVLLRAVLGLV